jgi:AraC-like DNA-binding protein
MKEPGQNILVSNLLYSCASAVHRGNEEYVTEHSFGYIVAGEVQFDTGDAMQVYREGTMGLVRRNQLIRTVKIPPPGGSFRAVNIFFDQTILREYSAAHQITASHYNGSALTLLPPDALLEGYFKSLLPYFEIPGKLTPSLVKLKTYEAIELLLQRDERWKDFLFDFSEPHKIDLERFMLRHYKFNVPNSQFARLTGRSLTAFKRDFEKIFHTSPERWLQKRRLQEAYYLLKERGQKPSDVYIETGFKNLSHFSTAFKKVYGITPSML